MNTPDFDKLLAEYKKGLSEINNLTKLVEFRNKFSNTYLLPLYADLKAASNEEKKSLGQNINIFKNNLNIAYTSAFDNINAELENKTHLVEHEVTLKSASLKKGALNPITIVADEIIDYFTSLGFQFYSGDEVTQTKFNFDYLNVPDKHPQRETSESFYISDTKVLRSQTTAVTSEILERLKDEPEIKGVSFGYTYRNDDDDASHSHQFNQLDFF
jgi:phenylalanyl-tRNA synthetase alpha chain